MKLPPFDMNKCQFDEFNRFHTRPGGYGKFVQFSTGELIAIYRKWSPDVRETYKDLDIQIAATTDDFCPPLYIYPTDTKPIPKSYLDISGSQTLLIDKTHGVVVSVEGCNEPATDQDDPVYLHKVPEDLHQRAAVYYHGKKSLPVGRPTYVRVPCRYTTEQMGQVEDLRLACVAWLVMQGGGEKEFRNAKWRTPWSVSDLLTYGDIIAMDSYARARLARAGYDKGFTTTAYEYLYVK